MAAHSMRYAFDGISLQNKRPSNMDSLLLTQRLIQDTPALLAVVCDGVGSLADGAVAAGTVARMLSDWFGRVDTAERLGLRLRDAILDINAHILAESKAQNYATASTLSALLLVDSGFTIAHIGDSRVYCLENDALSVLTNDDISETGKLTACIGRSEEIFLHYSEGRADGKTFLLCSDGLYKRMDSAFMAAKLREQKKKAFKECLGVLPQYVIERGEHDNITLALVKIEN